MASGRIAEVRNIRGRASDGNQSRPNLAKQKVIVT